MKIERKKEKKERRARETEIACMKNRLTLKFVIYLIKVLFNCQKKNFEILSFKSEKSENSVTLSILIK